MSIEEQAKAHKIWFDTTGIEISPEIAHALNKIVNEIKREAVEGLKMPYLEIDSRSMSNLEMHDRSIQNLTISQINAKVDKLLTQSKEGGE